MERPALSRSRKVAGRIGVASITTLLFACGGSSSSNTPIGSVYSPPASLEGRTMIVAGWGGNLDHVSDLYVAGEFGRLKGVKIVFDPTGPNFAPKVQAQAQAGNVQLDLLQGIPSAQAWFLYNQGLLVQLPASLVAELKAQSLPGSATDFGLNEGTTATVIACNPKLAAKCPSNAQQFFDVKNYPGPRAILNDPVHVTVWAAEAAGVPKDSIYPLDIPRVFNALQTVKPSVKVWTTSGDQQEQVMRDGEVAMAIVYSSRVPAIRTQLAAKGITVQISWDGADYDQSFVAVPKNAHNADVAVAFIDWYNKHPQAQADWSLGAHVGAATTQLQQLVPPSAYIDFPNAHPGLVEVDAQYYAVAANTAAVKTAWQQFLTG